MGLSKIAALNGITARDNTHIMSFIHSSCFRYTHNNSAVTGITKPHLNSRSDEAHETLLAPACLKEARKFWRATLFP